MKSRKWIVWIACAALLLMCLSLPASAEDTSSADLVILSTTDMHGKCWETNVLTDAPLQQNMLRVSTAVKEARAEYGEEYVILIDNGDTFQGTPVSEVHLLRGNHPEGEPEAMALCLTEIGYDAMVLGNHEFNYPWEIMSGVYEYLRENGVPVLAANAYWDGSDGVHAAGENAFGTFVIREVTVNGHPHKIGILGLENNDITRWDQPVNYPGLRFAHPDNPEYDEAAEANRYLPLMKEAGCEMIIVSYHGGMGRRGEDVRFGVNTDNQGTRILEYTQDIDLLIVGHDHSTGYSNNLYADAAGRQVPVVNGGSVDMTKTVFRLGEDADGSLTWELSVTENVSLSRYDPDPELQEKIRPYAVLASEMMDAPVGTLSGDWDGSSDFLFHQNDTQDLINASMITVGSQRMEAKYGESGLEALRAATGLDHLDVDAAVSSNTNGGFIARSGPVSVKDIYRMYRYSNNILILPMYGRDLKAVMEENAANRLTTRILNGRVYFFDFGDPFTHLLFGGINFTCDLAKPAGERITIEGFSSGRVFDPDALYLVAVHNYILANDHCGLRAWSSDDALWSQSDDDQGGTIQDIIREYIVLQEAAGGVTPDAFTWRWSLEYSDNPAGLPPYDGTVAAVLTEKPLDGHRYIVYQEAHGMTLTATQDTGGYEPVHIPAWGGTLVDGIPRNAQIFTAHIVDEDTLMLTDAKGRYLTAGREGGLMLTRESLKNDQSLWRLIPADGGYYILSVGASNNQALEYYDDRITTYRLSPDVIYLFNFYEVTGEAGE